MDSSPRPPDTTDAWNQAWPQTRREFEALVETFLDRLVSYACHRLGRLQDAEDVVQEVFVRTLTDRSKRKEITRVGPYLYRSVANACTDLLRKRGSGIVIRDGIAVDETCDPDASPSNAIEAAEEARQAERLLCQLPQDQAEVVRLRVMDELRLNEIADVVGCSPNTVSSRLRYAFRKLRSLVLEQKGVEP